MSGIVGAEHVSIAMADRLVHSRDMWPRSVLWTKRGHVPHPPDAVVSPATAEEVSALLRWASEHRIPVIPYGAGSGVCGGTIPFTGGIALNLKRMDEIHGIDSESLVAELGPGIYGETLERRLNPLGYTMGHFPSSIYCSTLGGYLAARSAGQMSSRYGKIEDMVVALEFVLPDGSIHRTSASSSGASRADWNQIIIGSEGTLAVITRAWMRVHPLPKHREFLAFHFPSIERGLEAMRGVMQQGYEPCVLRLYDEFDTIIAGTHGDPGEDQQGAEEEMPSLLRKAFGDAFGLLKRRSLTQALRRPGILNRLIDKLPGRCLLVVLTEGERDLAQFEAGQIRSICLDNRGRDAGEGPARYWLEHRYAISYKQSKIFDADGWVDTMEVATTWSNVPVLYQAVKKAVAPDAFIMAHFSHAYRDGCCIYFSFASSASSTERMEHQHARVWRNALSAVHAMSATITHHHGVGFSKGAMLPAEYGRLWPLYKKLKAKLDPESVMNPGKLGTPS